MRIKTYISFLKWLICKNAKCLFTIWLFICSFNKYNHLLFRFVCLNSDIEIARAHICKDIRDLANEIGLHSSEISLYGNTKAKIDLSVLKRLANHSNGKYVLVTGYGKFLLFVNFS